MKNSKLIIVQNYSNIPNEQQTKLEDKPYLGTGIFIIKVSILFAILYLFILLAKKVENFSTNSSIRSTTNPRFNAKKVENFSTNSSIRSTTNPRFKSLESQLRELASKAWKTEASFRYSSFVMNPNNFTHVTEPAKFVELLLNHTRNTVPGFQVPHMVPHVIIEALPFAAGQFHVDEQGWVTIKIGSKFFEDQLAAKAILAHEVCHYILENSGIRKKDFLLNERYTDMCMFICGFGQIFLNGYKREMARNEYRPGHRLGYLTDAEYEYASRYVMQLRQSKELTPPGELDVLKKRLLELVYNEATCQRLIEGGRKAHPYKSEVELYQDEINRLLRDRKR